MISRFLSFLTFTAMALSALSVHSAVKLPPLISDRMVLQRDADLKLWGNADAGECVTVRFRGDTIETKANNQGKWSVTLPAQTPGGPFILEINDILLRDVLVGDVILCGGQSNQETPIERLTWKFPEILVSNNHMVRHYKVPHAEDAYGPKTEMPNGAAWHSAIASDVMNWTALAYFLADELWNANGVPVGMLVCCKGGSDIESWLPQESLQDFPGYAIDLDALSRLPEASRIEGEGIYPAYDFDDSDWKGMSMPGTWKDNGLNLKGTVWMRKEFFAPKDMAGKDARLFLGTLMKADEAYVNGKFVGATGYEYPPRNYIIPAGIIKEGKNVVTIKLTDNDGTGAFIRDKKYSIVGDHGFNADLSGEWKYKIGKDFAEEQALRQRLSNIDKAGSRNYNAMLYPIRDYAVRGAVWYQGESNAGHPDDYEVKLTSLISDWRKLFGNDRLPFLIVQLPNFLEKQENPSDGGWAHIREAQLNTALKMPETALTCNYDCGEWNDIHPLDKKTVARRLMRAADAAIFGKNVSRTGPVVDNAEFNNGKAIITFRETGKGLKTSDGKNPRHFAIAGADGKFVWTTAKISGNKIIVSSPEVTHPVEVRYAWADNPVDANLRWGENEPVSPFKCVK